MENKKIDAELVVIINNLMYSSSSSSSSSSVASSSEDLDFLFLLNLFDKKENRKVKNFIENVVNNYTDEEFRRHFRVSRKVATTLTERFAKSRFYKPKLKNCGRKPASPETQCLSFLWFAGNKSTYREVSYLFNMCLSSAYKHQTAFMNFLFDISKQSIRMPSTSAQKEKKSREFSLNVGLKNVLGCIGVSNIHIRKPPAKSKHHINLSARPALTKIKVQGICDVNKKFLDVFVAPVKEINNSQMLKSSPISKDIPRICGTTYHLLGDTTYPLREFLLTPYPDYGFFTDKQKIYNEMHCESIVAINDCFSILKQRFRQLVRLDCQTEIRMSKFVIGCCVLHNLCIDEGDLWSEKEPIEEKNASADDISLAEEEEIDGEQESEMDLLYKGQLKREMITEAIEKRQLKSDRNA